MDYWVIGSARGLLNIMHHGILPPPNGPERLVVMPTEQLARKLISISEWKNHLPPCYMKISLEDPDTYKIIRARSDAAPDDDIRKAAQYLTVLAAVKPACEMPDYMQPIQHMDANERAHNRYWPLTSFVPAVYGVERLNIPRAPEHIVKLTEELRRALCRGSDFRKMIAEAEAAGFQLNTQIVRDSDGKRRVRGWSFTKGDVTIASSAAGISFDPRPMNPRSYNPKQHFAWLEKRHEARKPLILKATAMRTAIRKELAEIDRKALSPGDAAALMRSAGIGAEARDAGHGQMRHYFTCSGISVPYHRSMGSQLFRAAREMANAGTSEELNMTSHPQLQTFYHVTSPEAAERIKAEGFAPGWGDAGFGVYLFSDFSAADDYAADGGWDGELAEAVILEIRAPAAEVEPVIPEPDWPDPETYEHVVWHRMNEDDPNWQVEIVGDAEPLIEP